MRILPNSLTLVGFSAIALLAGCSSTPAATPDGTAGSGNAAAGSSPATGGNPSATGGSTGSTGGSGISTGGTATSSGGTATSSGGTTTSSGGTATSSGGTATGSGGSSSGGASGAGGGFNPDVDQMGKTNAKAGDKTSSNLDYLKMGEIRLINNNWGSVAWNCTNKSPSSVFVSADKKTFGWTFDRPDCSTESTKPDFPEIEFGIHPFGLGSSDATSPNFSSTTLLPKQLKDITQASVELTDLVIKLDKGGSWDLTFEFWLSKQNPATTQGNAGVYAELMTFWGWQDNRWPLNNGGKAICDIGCTNGLSAGSKNYDLLVQKDSWGSGWKYFQFRATGAPQTSFTGTVDVKKLIDYLVQKGGATQDMWLTRMEVGSEIDDDTKGTVTMSNVIFSVNNEKRSPVFGQ